MWDYGVMMVILVMENMVKMEPNNTHGVELLHFVGVH